MMYAVMMLGVALWAGAHLFQRVAPASRAALGAALLVLALVLMVVGYRGAAAVPVWFPPAFLVHLNNLLMLVAFYLATAALLRVRAARLVRHPLLAGVKAFALAHLLVNGDLASILLFGGILAWAVAEVIVINRAEPRPPPPPPAPLGREAGAVVSAVAGLAAVGWVHAWLGYWPFPV
jgi:uncharacterized membrane protein